MRLNEQKQKQATLAAQQLEQLEILAAQEEARLEEQQKILQAAVKEAEQKELLLLKEKQAYLAKQKKIEEDEKRVNIYNIILQIKDNLKKIRSSYDIPLYKKITNEEELEEIQKKLKKEGCDYEILKSEVDDLLKKTNQQLQKKKDNSYSPSKASPSKKAYSLTLPFFGDIARKDDDIYSSSGEED